MELLTKKNEDSLDKALSILARLGFGIYWLFDNLVVLCTVKFLKRDNKTFSKVGSGFWFLAIVAMAV